MGVPSGLQEMKEERMIQALLTIDDLPSGVTRPIVDYLKGAGIPALMFVIGEKAEKDPDPAVYAISQGMVLGNHSFSHPHFSALSVEEGIREIDRCEAVLERLYEMAGVPRAFRPFRFPYGDKGGKNREAFQAVLREKGFDRVKSRIPYAWWHEKGLDREVDTLWTFDFAEYRIRPGSGFTLGNVWDRFRKMNPEEGVPLLMPDGRHMLLLHAHDETEEMVPGYYRLLLDELVKQGVRFLPPEFE
jgi:peptidoglycan/xylan/chitin deacetylase (PgdA/CDA1 family)